MILRDATRMEAWGPPVGALFIYFLSATAIGLIKDSQYMVSLLNSRYDYRGPFLFHCVELTRATLLDCTVWVIWVPYTQNVECDDLSHRVCFTGLYL